MSISYRAIDHVWYSHLSTSAIVSKLTITTWAYRYKLQEPYTKYLDLDLYMYIQRHSVEHIEITLKRYQQHKVKSNPIKTQIKPNQIPVLELGQYLHANTAYCRSSPEHGVMMSSISAAGRTQKYRCRMVESIIPFKRSTLQDRFLMCLVSR